jgi:hypothetical protein
MHHRIPVKYSQLLARVEKEMLPSLANHKRALVKVCERQGQIEGRRLKIYRIIVADRDVNVCVLTRVGSKEGKRRLRSGQIAEEPHCLGHRKVLHSVAAEHEAHANGQGRSRHVTELKRGKSIARMKLRSPLDRKRRDIYAVVAKAWDVFAHAAASTSGLNRTVHQEMRSLHNG